LAHTYERRGRRSPSLRAASVDAHKLLDLDDRGEREGLWSNRRHCGAARRLRSHQPIGWDQAMIGYFHVRRTVRNA